MSEYRYLIIGGTSKAGTTSLFAYLADHPRICASSMKGTHFFLEADNRGNFLSAKYHFEDGLNKYEIYFNHCKGEQLRLESSPQYLYSSSAPHKIKTALPNVKLVFILRDPIDRLVSVYRFLKQLNKLPVQVSFEEFVRLKLENSGHDGLNLPYRKGAVEHGKYSIYLQPYFNIFERDRICILMYEDLKLNPVTVLSKVCRFANIDPSFYQDYKFRIFNRTQTMKSFRLHEIYRKTILSMRNRVLDKPRVRTTLRIIRRRIEPFYLRLNRRSDEPVQISPALRRQLIDIYREDVLKLQELIQQDLSHWLK